MATFQVVMSFASILLIPAILVIVKLAQLQTRQNDQIETLQVTLQAQEKKNEKLEKRLDDVIKSSGSSPVCDMRFGQIEKEIAAQHARLSDQISRNIQTEQRLGIMDVKLEHILDIVNEIKSALNHKGAIPVKGGD